MGWGKFIRVRGARGVVDDVGGGAGGLGPMCFREIGRGDEGSGYFEDFLDSPFGVEGVVGMWRGEGLGCVGGGKQLAEGSAGVGGALVGVDGVYGSGRGVLGTYDVGDDFGCL